MCNFPRHCSERRPFNYIPWLRLWILLGNLMCSMSCDESRYDLDEVDEEYGEEEDDEG